MKDTGILLDSHRVTAPTQKIPIVQLIPDQNIFFLQKFWYILVYVYVLFAIFYKNIIYTYIYKYVYAIHNELNITVHIQYT